MARRAVDDDAELYRVVILRRAPRALPDGPPYWIWDGELHTIAYGPYNSIGPAKAQLRRESERPQWRGGGRLPGVEDAWIERADIAWERVE